MAFNAAVAKAIEKLDYRATVGDVASQAGIDLDTSERGLLALASDAGGHMQVAESGEIAYVFPKNFRSVLRSKSSRLRRQEMLQKVWNAAFYVIRISFGVLLIASIVLISIAIVILLIAMNSQRDSNNSSSSSSSRSGPSFIFFPRFFGPDIFWMFDPNYSNRRRRQLNRSTVSSQGGESELNFLEAVFSFLFGDGNPNENLEEQRWQSIATVIRNNDGAVIAEQVAPYLDDLGSKSEQEYEDYMLPVLTRFNGRPQVSPTGEMIYHFPELQVTASAQTRQSVSAYLKENFWQFSQASSGQLTMAAGLGVLNFVLAIVLMGLLQDQQLVAELGGLVALVNLIFPALFAYGTAFLGIPIIRYFWLQKRNAGVQKRNQKRQQRAIALNEADAELQSKKQFARQFAAQAVINESDLAYTTEEELVDQEIANRDRIDAEWQRRLEQS